MLRKSLFVIIMIIFVSLQQIKASDDWLDFEVGASVGLNGGYGYGYEALLEYKFSEDTSLYITGNIMKDMEAKYTDNHDYDMETGNSQMLGMQIRWTYFLLGYHRVIKHETTLNVIEKATTATSFGLISSEKKWDIGLLFYIYNDKARNAESSSSGGFFLRRKFFF